MRQKSHFHTARGFTLTELLVVIAIIAVLATLSFISFGAVRERARLASCAENLRTWGVVFQSYAADHNGAVQWNNWASISSNDRYYETFLGGDGTSASGTMNGKRVLLTQVQRRCPGQTWDGIGNGPVGYAMIRPNPKVPNSTSYNLNTATNQSQLLVLIDADSYLTLSSPSDLSSAVEPICTGKSTRHRATANALFADGHVSGYKWGDLSGNDSNKKSMLDQWFTLK